MTETESLVVSVVTETERESLVVSVVRAGKLLGCSRPTAYKMVKAGILPVLHLGTKKLVVPKAAIERMIAEACKIKES